MGHYLGVLLHIIIVSAFEAVPGKVRMVQLDTAVKNGYHYRGVPYGEFVPYSFAIHVDTLVAGVVQAPKVGCPVGVVGLKLYGKGLFHVLYALDGAEGLYGLGDRSFLRKFYPIPTMEAFLTCARFILSRERKETFHAFHAKVLGYAVQSFGLGTQNA